VRRRAALGQQPQRRLDLAQRDANPLGCADERYPAEHRSFIPALIPWSPTALDKTFGLIEVQRRHAHPAAGGQLADRQLRGNTLGGIHGVDLNLT
jgi:hypothetical protein